MEILNILSRNLASSSRYKSCFISIKRKRSSRHLQRENTPDSIRLSSIQAGLKFGQSQGYSLYRHLPENNFNPLKSTLHRLQFPETRLIQYDCGKLQVLYDLIFKLKPKGHRNSFFIQNDRLTLGSWKNVRSKKNLSKSFDIYTDEQNARCSRKISFLSFYHLQEMILLCSATSSSGEIVKSMTHHRRVLKELLLGVEGIRGTQFCFNC